jgi:hypothetical protein
VVALVAGPEVLGALPALAEAAGTTTLSTQAALAGMGLTAHGLEAAGVAFTLASGATGLASGALPNGWAATVLGTMANLTAAGAGVTEGASGAAGAGDIDDTTAGVGGTKDTAAGDGATEAGVGAVRVEMRNGYTYTLDAEGRVTDVEGDLTSNPSQGRNPRAQLEAGGVDRLPTDEGGHFVGRRFNGPLDAFNHFAQNMNFNRGAYKSLENRWQDAIEGGEAVHIEIVPHYPGGSLRPDSLEVNYKIGGIPRQQVFTNRPGG